MHDTDGVGGSSARIQADACRPLFDQLETATLRLSALRERAAASTRDDHLLCETFQELDVAHEELRAAEEHVHAQADALVLAQRAIADERRLYRDLFESAPAAYVLTDHRGNIVEANLCAMSLLRTERRLLSHRPLVGFLEPADRSLFRDQLSQLIQDDTIACFELRVRARRTHEAVRVSISASRALGPDGEPSGVRWLFRQVQDRDAAHASWLERCLASERALRERAEADAEEKEQLLVGVAHRLRKPLGSIAEWLQVISSGMGQADAKQHAIASLGRNVRTLMRVVHSVLERLSSGREPTHLNPVPVDLGPLLANLVEEYRPMARYRGIRLQASIAVSSCELWGDPHRLRVALNDLLSHALRFTSPGGEVLVSSRRAEGSISVRIRDSGCGIAAELLPSLGDEQGDAQHVAGPEGEASLGLQLARDCIELHGGVITAHSAGEGGGTALTVTLPVTRPPGNDDDPR